MCWAERGYAVDKHHMEAEVTATNIQHLACKLDTEC